MDDQPKAEIDSSAGSEPSAVRPRSPIQAYLDHALSQSKEGRLPCQLVFLNVPQPIEGVVRAAEIPDLYHIDFLTKVQKGHPTQRPGTDIAVSMTFDPMHVGQVIQILGTAGPVIVPPSA